MHQKVWVIILSLFLVGCSTAPKQASTQWIFDKTWYEKNKSGNVVFNGLEGRTLSVKGQYLWNFYQVSAKLINLTQISTALVITNQPALNAFAYQQFGVNHIGITIDMLDKFGDDNDVLAVIIGHELAHLKLAHQSDRIARKKSTDSTQAVIGGALGALIPFGATLTNLGATAYTNSFTRDEEREADKLGLYWAMQAGYSPCGAVRLQSELLENSKSTILFLSTHPVNSERLSTARQLAINNNYGSCE